MTRPYMMSPRAACSFVKSLIDSSWAEAIKAYVLLFVFSSTSAYAQMLATQFSVNEGLPQSTVTSLYRDNGGALWIGTGEGLSVYNGIGFNNFASDSPQNKQLTNSRIRGIVPADDGQSMWVGSEDGFTQLDRFGNKVLQRLQVFESDGGSHEVIKACDTAIWALVGGRGLFRISLPTKKAYALKSIYYDKRGDLRNDIVPIVDTSEYLYFVNILNGSARRISYKGIIGRSTITKIITPWNNNDYLIMTERGLYIYEHQKNVIRPYEISLGGMDSQRLHFTSLAVHPDGSWWIGVYDHGVYRYEPDTKHSRKICRNQDGSSFGDQTKSITQIVCDRYGVVWFGTNGSGLFKVVTARIPFADNYFDELATDTCKWFIRSFLELDSGRMIIGTYLQGLKLVDYHNKSIRTVALAPPPKMQPTVLSMIRLDENTVLAGTDNDLYVIELKNFTFRKIPVPYDNLQFKVMYRTRSASILIGSSYRLYEYNVGTSSIEEACSDPLNVSSIFETENGDIIIGFANNSIRRYDSRFRIVRTRKFDQDYNLPKLTTVNSIWEDENNVLWLATNQGLLKLDAQLDILRKYTTANGLSDRVVYGLLPIQQNELILTTGKGVTIFNRLTEQSRIIRFEHGLPSNECNSGALYATSDNRIYIGTISGFCYANVNRLQMKFQPATINLFYKTSSGEYQPLSGVVELPFDKEIPLFGAWSTDFAFSELSTINLILISSSAQVLPVVNGQIQFSNLASGKYLLRWKYRDYESGFEEYSPAIQLSIIPPFWKRPWFYTVIIVAAAIVLVLIVRAVLQIRHRNELRDLMLQQELEKIRVRISRDIHDEIGAGLTRIALSGDLIARTKIDDTETQTKISFISATARELSQSMKEVVWVVNPVNDSLDKMLYYFREWIGELADVTEPKLLFQLHGNPDQRSVNPEVRRNLLLILKEGISNALKYSGAHTISVEFTFKPDGTLRVLIADDGIGFDISSNTKQNSNGIINMKQRAEAINFSFEIKSGKGLGTRIELTGVIQQ